MQRQLKFNRAMAKTLKVHVLYGDHNAIATVISRLVEHEFSFNYSGEYLYSSTPWDAFIDEYCQDIKAQLNPCVENWADSCLLSGFQGKDSDTEFSVKVNGEEKFKAYTCPLYAEAFKHFLLVMRNTMAIHALDIDYNALPKKF